MVQRAEIPQKDPEKVPGALINVAKHVSSLKYHIWEKMVEVVQYSKEIPIYVQLAYFLVTMTTVAELGDLPKQCVGFQTRNDISNIFTHGGITSFAMLVRWFCFSAHHPGSQHSVLVVVHFQGPHLRSQQRLPPAAPGQPGAFWPLCLRVGFGRLHVGPPRLGGGGG